MPNSPAAGMYCYKAIMAGDSPCSQCPARDIRSKGSRTVLMRNPICDCRMLADASLIRWNGEEACLLTCRQIPGENT